MSKLDEIMDELQGLKKQQEELLHNTIVLMDKNSSLRKELLRGQEDGTQNDKSGHILRHRI